VENKPHSLIFNVWNAQSMSRDIAMHVFQRNFSTKSEADRGLGTYAMKLFGETYLRGTVRFSTSRREGTTFHLELPKKPRLRIDPPLNVNI